jgi:N-acetylglucosaminyldiphosphoundecaprenol N-acetyl-beta-D-mannosaminyltransferase
MDQTALGSIDPPRINILGVAVSAINMDQALDFVTQRIETLTPSYICVTPAHGVMDCQADPALRRIFNGSGLTTPDGMAIVWLLKLHGHAHASRVYGPDLMSAVCAMSVQHGYQHYFYGGAPGVAELLAARLQARYPGLRVAGIYSPPFRPLTPEEDCQVVARINASEPDIVWVGISTPKQERWMSEHVGRVTAPVMVGVGAAFDFLSGRKKQAPRWMQRAGLEWLFRLGSEPRRLWRRYLRYPQFALLVLAQLLRVRCYRLE